MALITNCQKNSVKIVLSQTEISAPAEGGHFSVAYSVENGQGEEPATATTDVDWITDIDNSTYGTIDFVVARSRDEEPRSAVITIKHAEAAEPVLITVSQAMGNPDPFVIEITETTPVSIEYDIQAADEEMRYVCMNIYQEYIEDNELQSDDALFEDDMDYFDYLMSQGISMEEILENLTAVGSQSGLAISDLCPESAYVIYVYGISVEGEVITRLTDIVRSVVTTAEMPKQDAEWNITVTLDQSDALVNVKTDFGGPWYFDVLSKADIDEAYPDMSYEEAAEVAFNEMVNMYLGYGFAASDIISLMSSDGEEDEYLFSLDPESDFIAYAMGLDESSAYCCTNVGCKEFTTGAVMPSDNVIDISVTEITPVSANVAVTTTNDDPYTVCIGFAAEIADMDDTELFQYFKENWQLGRINGDISEVVDGLTPETEYFVVGFGYRGGVMTTDFCKVFFTTNAQKSCEDLIVFEYGDYYDTEAVYNIDNSWDYRNYDVFLKVSATSDPADNGGDFYFGLFSEKTLEGFSDAEIRNSLVEEGICNSDEIWILKYNDDNGDPNKFVIAGFVTNASGDWGPMVRTEPFVINESGVNTNAQECVDLLNDLYAGSSAPVRLAPVSLFAEKASLFSERLANPVRTKAINDPLGYISFRYPEMPASDIPEGAISRSMNTLFKK